MNSTQEEHCMNDFCDTYYLENHINEPTCFKNPINPSSIYIMLTNRKRSFQNSMTIETGLSDHHKMTISILKTFFKKNRTLIWINLGVISQIPFKIVLIRQ